MKLVPRKGIDGHKVVFGNRLHVGTDAHRTAAAQDQHGMSVLMLLERRIAAGRNLKITQLACVVRLGEQDSCQPKSPEASMRSRRIALMRSPLPPLRLRR